MWVFFLWLRVKRGDEPGLSYLIISDLITYFLLVHVNVGIFIGLSLSFAFILLLTAVPTIIFSDHFKGILGLTIVFQYHNQ